VRRVLFAADVSNGLSVCLRLGCCNKLCQILDTTEAVGISLDANSRYQLVASSSGRHWNHAPYGQSKGMKGIITLGVTIASSWLSMRTAKVNLRSAPGKAASRRVCGHPCCRMHCQLCGNRRSGSRRWDQSVGGESRKTPRHKTKRLTTGPGQCLVEDGIPPPPGCLAVDQCLTCDTIARRDGSDTASSRLPVPFITGNRTGESALQQPLIDESVLRPCIVHLESPTSRKQKKLAVEQTECWDRLPSLLPEFHRDLHGPGFLPARAINSHPSLRGCERRRSAPHSKILSDASRVQLKAWEPASSLNSQQLDAAGIHRAGWDFRNNQDSISVPLKNRFIRWEHPAAETVNMLYI
jgi:hypothetical protein